MLANTISTFLHLYINHIPPRSSHVCSFIWLF